MHPKPVFPPVMTTTLFVFLFVFVFVVLLVSASLMDDDDIGRTNRSRRRCRTSKALERSLENETEGTFWERNEAHGILVSLLNA
jgi:hypothetical protein